MYWSPSVASVMAPLVGSSHAVTLLLLGGEAVVSFLGGEAVVSFLGGEAVVVRASRSVGWTQSVGWTHM